MTNDCTCDYDPPDFYFPRRIKAARKQHKCEECGSVIAPGESYEYLFAQWDGFRATIFTCERCVELREWAKISVPCFCWTHGNLLDDVETMVEEVRYDVPGFFFEYGRRIVKINRQKCASP
jgi:hypothetical protein